VGVFATNLTSHEKCAAVGNISRNDAFMSSLAPRFKFRLARNQPKVKRLVTRGRQMPSIVDTIDSLLRGIAIAAEGSRREICRPGENSSSTGNGTNTVE
jgi:hypothetical protein